MGLESRWPGERAVRLRAWLFCWMRESLILCACTSRPCACHTRWGQRDQRTEGLSGSSVITVLVCCLSKWLASCHRISTDRGWEETPPSSDLGVISNICPEIDYFQEDLSRGQVLQAVTTAGLRVRAEMGWKGQFRRGPHSFPEPCRQPDLWGLSLGV